MNRLIFVTPLLLALVACSETAHHLTTNTNSRETGQPALHAIHNNRLRELMGRMNNLMQERFLTEPELDAEHRRYTQQISSTAKNLSQTIDTISATLPSLQLSATEQTTFLALVSRLHEQTQTLQEQAKQNRMTSISSTLEQINTTCTSCHALFRKQ